MKVSVVIPSYNRGPLIAETIASILAQTHAPAEVIVVDDGSTDDTASVVRQFPGVRYERIHNSGVCRARNVGVALTRSPWLAFCDSDDLWEPDKLETQFRVIRRAPGVEYSFTNFVTFTANGEKPGTKFDDVPVGYWDDLPLTSQDADGFVVTVSLYERLLRYQPIFPSTVLMTRDFFYRVGGVNDNFGRLPAEDVEFALRCVQEPPLAVVARPVVRVRKHESNFSGSQLRTLVTGLTILEHAQAHHRTARQRPALLARLLALHRIRTAEAAFDAGNLELVRRLEQTIPLRERGFKLHLKCLTARLPAPLGHGLQRVLVSLSSATTRPGKPVARDRLHPDVSQSHPTAPKRMP